jgi:hypothetical protein
MIEVEKGKTIQAYSITNQSTILAGLYYIEKRETKGFTFLTHSSTNVPEHQTNVGLVVFQIHPWVLHESTAMPFLMLLQNCEKLHSAKRLEVTSLCNACCLKGKYEYKTFRLHVIGTSYT